MLIGRILTPLLILWDVSMCDWVEIPQVITKRQYQQSASPPIHTPRPPPRQRLPPPGPAINHHIEVSTQRTDSHNLEELVDDALFNLRDPLETTPQPYETEDGVDVDEDDADVDDEYEDDLAEETVESKQNPDAKGSLFTAAGFIPLLKTIQQTLTMKQQTTQNKVQMLEGIKDNLLANIEYRMNQLWNPTSNRNARIFKDKHQHDHHYDDSGHDKGGSHVDFPSNAAALLALSFLTFAVYLIKLVLQVIQTMQMRTTTTTALAKRTRRSTEDYNNVARILQLMESYSFD